MAAVATVPPPDAGGGVGGLLRDWRKRRRLSQMDLALTAEVSTRHLSFVETGRSTPSRELVIHLAEHLDVPLRDRNGLLLAGGYAPAYEETPMEADEMGPVRDALDQIVGGHEPFPAIVVDRHWDLVTTNGAAIDMLTAGVAPHLLEPPINALRVSVHPDGMAPNVLNFEQWADHLLDRLDRQIAVTGDEDLADLATELRSYPGVRPVAPERIPLDTAGRLFVPLGLRHQGGELRFFSTIATFGTALDITVAELSIESFFPADEATAAALGRPAA
jgi:transcriptional regulator with XRE-family HTH domain